MAAPVGADGQPAAGVEVEGGVAAGRRRVHGRALGRCRLGRWSRCRCPGPDPMRIVRSMPCLPVLKSVGRSCPGYRPRRAPTERECLARSERSVSTWWGSAAEEPGRPDRRQARERSGALACIHPGQLGARSAPVVGLWSWVAGRRRGLRMCGSPTALTFPPRRCGSGALARDGLGRDSAESLAGATGQGSWVCMVGVDRGVIGCPTANQPGRHRGSSESLM